MCTQGVQRGVVARTYIHFHQHNRVKEGTANCVATLYLNFASLEDNNNNNNNNNSTEITKYIIYNIRKGRCKCSSLSVCLKTVLKTFSNWC